MSTRELAPHEPFCPRCDLLRGDGVMPMCTCGRTVEERRAEGFADAVGLTRVEWLTKEEMLERYPSSNAKRADAAPKDSAG